MSQFFFIVPFANTGDVSPVPVDAQPDGSESFEKGFPINYQEDPDSEPTAKLIDREQFNYLMNLITGNIQVLQTRGFPDFITTSDNDGVPYPYEINAICRFTGGWASAGAANYISLIAANTTDPTNQTNWGLIAPSRPELTGTIKTVSDSVNLPTGYIWANGQTIGNAASNATARANADTQALFNIYWAYSQAVLPIYTSAGALSVRGVSASADYAANKAIAVPNLMGSVVAGLDGMGGAPATSLLTTAGSNISGVTPGASGGAQSVSLTAAQNGPHTHGPGGGATSFRQIGAAGRIMQFSAGNPDAQEIDSATTASSGSGTAHLNVQPTVVLPIIIALGTA